MPISGSYYYPVMQKPTSTLGGGTADLTEKDTAPAAQTGKGRLFVSGSDGSNFVYFIEENGTIVKLTGSVV